MTTISGVARPPGHIVTFYSYKGGVGRTFTMANVAALLAQWGHSVLAVDWDLEAPGLHTYFGIDRRPGLVNALVEYKAGAALEWARHIVTIPLSLSKGGTPAGRLDFLSAGDGDDYPARVQGLDWATLYEEKQLGSAIEEMLEEWRVKYDVVLIDSRTGISDVGAICTAQLPDTLVLVATPNRQSFDGLKQVLGGASRARAALPEDRAQLNVLPILTRLDVRQEYVEAQEWLHRFATVFEDEFRTWLPRAGQGEATADAASSHLAVTVTQILNMIRVPYVPFWGHGEKLAIERADVHDPDDVGFAFGSIAALLARRLAFADQLIAGRHRYLKDAQCPPRGGPAPTQTIERPDPKIVEAAEFIEWMAIKWQRLGAPRWLLLYRAPWFSNKTALGISGRIAPDSAAGQYLGLSKRISLISVMLLMLVPLGLVLAGSVLGYGALERASTRMSQLLADSASQCTETLAFINTGLTAQLAQSGDTTKRAVQTQVLSGRDSYISSRLTALSPSCERWDTVSCEAIRRLALEYQNNHRVDALTALTRSCIAGHEPSCLSHRAMIVVDAAQDGGVAVSDGGGAAPPSQFSDQIKASFNGVSCLRDLRTGELVDCGFAREKACDRYLESHTFYSNHQCIVRPRPIHCTSATTGFARAKCFATREECAASPGAACESIEPGAGAVEKVEALTTRDKSLIRGMHHASFCVEFIPDGSVVFCSFETMKSCNEYVDKLVGDSHRCIDKPDILYCGKANRVFGPDLSKECFFRASRCAAEMSPEWCSPVRVGAPESKDAGAASPPLSPSLRRFGLSAERQIGDSALFEKVAESGAPPSRSRMSVSGTIPIVFLASTPTWSNSAYRFEIRLRANSAVVATTQYAGGVQEGRSPVMREEWSVKATVDTDTGAKDRSVAFSLEVVALENWTYRSGQFGNPPDRYRVEGATLDMWEEVTFKK